MTTSFCPTLCVGVDITWWGGSKRSIASRRTAPPAAPEQALESLLEKMAPSFKLTEAETTILIGTLPWTGL